MKFMKIQTESKAKTDFLEIANPEIVHGGFKTKKKCAQDFTTKKTKKQKKCHFHFFWMKMRAFGAPELPGS